MASVLPRERAFLLSLLFACFQFSIGGLLKGAVTCIDCSPLYDLSGVRLAVNCSKEEILSYALTDTEGQFQILISKPSLLLPSDCSVNLLGGKTQLCGFKKSITSKIIAINSSRKSSNSFYNLQTPLAFWTSCKEIVAKEKLEKTNGINNGGGPALGEEKVPRSSSDRDPRPPVERFALPPLPPLIYVFPFIPIIGIP